jgi:hypothetical protein
VKVTFRTAGFDELRKSPGVVAMLEAKAAELAEAAGDGFEAKPVELGRKRARVAVVATTPEAMVAEARNHNLIRALGQVTE